MTNKWIGQNTKGRKYKVRKWSIETRNYVSTYKQINLNHCYFCHWMLSLEWSDKSKTNKPISIMCCAIMLTLHIREMNLATWGSNFDSSGLTSDKGLGISLTWEQKLWTMRKLAKRNDL